MCQILQKGEGAAWLTGELDSLVRVDVSEAQTFSIRRRCIETAHIGYWLHLLSWWSEVQSHEAALVQILS